MYLSIIRINETEMFISQNDRNEEHVHQTLMAACNNISRQESNLLYRKDGMNVCSYSNVPLNRDILTKNGYVLVHEMKVDDLYRHIQPNDCLKILIKTVPSVKKDRPNNHNSMRYHLTQREERIEWVKNKMTQSGLEVLTSEENLPLIIEDGHNDIEFKHSKYQKNRGNAKFQSYQYIVSVKVKDVNLFLDKIGSGIGPYKSYGCGMIMVGAL